MDSDTVAMSISERSVTKFPCTALAIVALKIILSRRSPETKYVASKIAVSPGFKPSTIVGVVGPCCTAVAAPVVVGGLKSGTSDFIMLPSVRLFFTEKSKVTF